MSQQSLPIKKEPVPRWKNPAYLKWREEMKAMWGKGIFNRPPNWRML